MAKFVLKKVFSCETYRGITWGFELYKNDTHILTVEDRGDGGETRFDYFNDYDEEQLMFDFTQILFYHSELKRHLDNEIGFNQDGIALALIEIYDYKKQKMLTWED